MRNPLKPGAAVLFVALAVAPVCAGVLQSAGSQQATSSGSLPPATEILERHLKAVGGREAVLARSSMHAMGKIEMPAAGVSGTFELFAAKPNRTLLRMTIPGVGDFQEGFNGDIGWSVNPMTGPTLMQGVQLEQRKLDSDFYALVHPEKRYDSITTVEQTEFDGRRCYKLRLVRRGGGDDFQFYDVKTGLKAGSITTRETPMGTMTSTSTETEYKPFGGVLQATKLSNTVMNLQQVMTFERMEFDKVEPSVFELPEPIKALIK